MNQAPVTRPRRKALKIDKLHRRACDLFLDICHMREAGFAQEAEMLEEAKRLLHRVADRLESR